MSTQRTDRRTRWLPAGYSLLLALLVTAPLLAPGYLLLRDAVSTPRSYLTDTALGLGDAAPRAVPQDALLAVLSPLIDGGVLVEVILLGALWAAGYGAAVLVRELLRAPLAAQLVATTLAVWNPYVAERLLQGHWSLLTGYAALPWVVVTALRVRARCGRPRAETQRSSRVGDWVALGGVLAAAGLTPTGALLAGIVAVVVAGWRRLAGVLALTALVCLPWLMATAVSGMAAEPSDPEGIPAFAARAEPGLGTLGSLAGLGGIWNADAVPATRTTPLAAIATVLLLAVVGFGIRRAAAADGDPERTRARRRLLLLAAAAVVLPALAATPAGIALLEWLVVQVPGAGLLRDTQKYVALAVPGYALCVAAACSVRLRRPGRTRIPAAAIGPRSDSAVVAGPDTAPGETTGATTDTHPSDTADTQVSSATHRWSGNPAQTCPSDTVADSPAGKNTDEPTGTNPAETVAGAPGASRAAGRGSSFAPAAAALFIAALLLPLLDLGWGVGGQMRAIRYPDAWHEVAERIDGPGDIAILPGGMFRRFPYSGSAPVLDPAPRMLPGDVLQTGDLPVRGRNVSGEGVRAGTVEKLLRTGGTASELARLGVGWVLVERDTPGPLGESATTLAQLHPVYRSDELALYQVPDVRPTPAAHHRPLVIAAHILWASLLVAPLLSAMLGLLTRRASGADRTQPGSVSG